MKKNTMKKNLCILLIGFLLGLSLTGFGAEFVAQLASFPVYVNGKVLQTDKPIVAIEGSTYLPLKAIGEALGVSVKWNGEAHRVEIDSSAGVRSDFVRVVRVIDGDTFEIEGGQKVRLIGVDTPETVKPGEAVQAYGKEASAFTKSMLEGKTVRLEKDVSETDKYGRLLRYVYLEDGTFFNELLVKEGYAKAATYPPDVKYADVFVAAQQYAAKNNKGLWNTADAGVSARDATQEQLSAKGKIKGNISSTGEKIYHVPGGAYYDQTIAEEYFDTEEEAQAAGYRKSSR